MLENEQNCLKSDRKLGQKVSSIPILAHTPPFFADTTYWLLPRKMSTMLFEQTNICIWQIVELNKTSKFPQEEIVTFTAT